MPHRTVKVDGDLLERVRAAMGPAAPADDAKVVELALRSYLGRRALTTAQLMSDLSEDEAMRMAYEELHSLRLERRTT